MYQEIYQMDEIVSGIHDAVHVLQYSQWVPHYKVKSINKLIIYQICITNLLSFHNLTEPSAEQEAIVQTILSTSELLG